MGQKKLVRFEELKTFPNVLQHPEGIAGHWNEFWKNDNPTILELACGKGEYAVGLAGLYPGNNFIGIDLKGNRIWVGAKKALLQGLKNVAFYVHRSTSSTTIFHLVRQKLSGLLSRILNSANPRQKKD